MFNNTKILILMTTLLAAVMVFFMAGCNQPKTYSLAGDNVYQGDNFTGNVITAASLIAPTGRTATYVIAANNSTALVKSQADYVCDGIADEVQINAACLQIASLIPYGGKIHFSAGNYSITSPILYYQNTFFEGEGVLTTVLTLADSANCNMFQFHTTAGAGDNIGCRWDGLLLAGNSANNPTNASCGIKEANYFYDFIIANCFINDFKGSCLNLAGVWNGNINNCIFENSDYGIYLVGNQDVKIISNKFLYNRYGITITNTKDVLFSGNFFYHANGLNHWTDHDYDITIDGNSTRVQVVDNRFQEGISSGTVYMIRIASTVGDNIIANNCLNGGGTVRGIADSAVRASGNPNIIVNNQIYNVSAYPMLISSTTDKPLISNNAGYIAPGEIRSYSGSLTAGNANAFAFIWQNPEAQKVLVTKVQVEVTTPGGTGSSVLDVGTGATATTHNDNLIDGVDVNSAAVYDSMNSTDKGTNGVMKPVLVDENGGTTDYVTGQILVANAASLVGKYYITVVGR